MPKRYRRTSRRPKVRARRLGFEHLEDRRVMATLVSVTATDPHAAEPDDNGQFSITLTDPSATDTIVYYETRGDATPESDYVALPGSITILAGSTEGVIEVIVINDNIQETTERVVLTITGFIGDEDVSLGSTSATVKIDDPRVFAGSLGTNEVDVHEITAQGGEEIRVSIAPVPFEYQINYGFTLTAYASAYAGGEWYAPDPDAESGTRSAPGVPLTLSNPDLNWSASIQIPAQTMEGAGVFPEDGNTIATASISAQASISASTANLTTTSIVDPGKTRLDYSVAASGNTSVIPGGAPFGSARTSAHAYFTPSITANYSGETVGNYGPFGGSPAYAYYHNTEYQAGFPPGDFDLEEGVSTGFFEFVPDLFTPHAILVSPSGKMYEATTREITILHAERGMWTIYVSKNTSKNLPTDDDPNRAYVRPYEVEVAVSPSPSVVNVITHGWIPPWGSVSQTQTAWNEYAKILNGMPAANSDLDGRVKTYVSDWDSSVGFTDAVGFLVVAKVYESKALDNPILAELYNNIATNFKQRALLVSSQRSAPSAVAAAHSIASQVETEFLLPTSDSNATQKIQLIGHSRGAAVNALVSKILTERQFNNLVTFVSLDGFSTDWGDDAGLLGDISIVKQTRVSPGGRKLNYMVQTGLAGIPAGDVLALLAGLPPSSVDDLQAPTRADFTNPANPIRFEDKTIIGDSSTLSNHINIHDFYFGIKVPNTNEQYYKDTYLGMHSNDMPSGTGSVASSEFEFPGSGAIATDSLAEVISFGFADGGFDSVGNLWTQALGLDLTPTGDEVLDALLMSAIDPAAVLTDIWEVTGDVRLIESSGDFSVELNHSTAGTAISRLVLLPPQATAVEFDVDVLSANAGDLLSVIFDGELLSEIDLTQSTDGRHSVLLPSFADFSGTFTFALSSPSGSATITLDNLEIAFENSAPILTPIQTELPPILTTMSQEVNHGVSPADLGLTVMDADGPVAHAIAIVAANVQHGILQYSIDSGESWIDVENVSDEHALLLSPRGGMTRLRFVPILGFSGKVEDLFTFRAWDRTTGITGLTGDYYDASEVGGSTPFSAETGIASIHVFGVIDHQSVAAFREILPVPGDSETSPNAISADGSVVVGESWNDNDSQPFRWSNEMTIGLQHVTSGPFLYRYASAKDVSADGTWIVGDGWAELENGNYFERGMVWNGQDVVYLDSENGIALYAISDDGRVVVGKVGGAAFRQEEGVRTGLPPAPGYTRAEVLDVSADGRIAIGYSSRTSGNPKLVATLWNETVATNLGPGIAASVSADGHTVIGRLDDRPVYWREGTMYTIATNGVAHGVSQKGELIVGSMFGVAYVWSSETGARLLDIPDWSLHSAEDVTIHEGQVHIVGSGTNPDGFYRGWSMTIPLSEFVTDVGILGDYDLSGYVDHDDYITWKSQYGEIVTPGSGADGNYDGAVDAADYTVWRNNLGAGTPPEASGSAGFSAVAAAEQGTDFVPLTESVTLSHNFRYAAGTYNDALAGRELIRHVFVASSSSRAVHFVPTGREANSELLLSIRHRAFDQLELTLPESSSSNVIDDSDSNEIFDSLCVDTALAEFLEG